MTNPEQRRYACVKPCPTGAELDWVADILMELYFEGPDISDQDWSNLQDSLYPNE